MRRTSFTIHAPRRSSKRSPSGSARPVRCTPRFYFPFDDYHNIRFDPQQEPTGALGDMAWYSMRAVVEYLRPKGKITSALAVPERHSRDRSGHPRVAA